MARSRLASDSCWYLKLYLCRSITMTMFGGCWGLMTWNQLKKSENPQKARSVIYNIDLCHRSKQWYMYLDRTVTWCVIRSKFCVFLMVDLLLFPFSISDEWLRWGTLVLIIMINYFAVLSGLWSRVLAERESTKI